MAEFTQGICADGAAILKDGVMLTVEEIIELLRQGDALMGQGEPVAWVYETTHGRSVSFNRIPDDDLQKGTVVRPVFWSAPAVDGAVLKDAERYRWIKSNIKEEMLEGGNHDFGGHPGCKYVLPRIISYRDYCGIITFDEAIDIAIKGEG